VKVSIWRGDAWHDVVLENVGRATIGDIAVLCGISSNAAADLLIDGIAYPPGQSLHQVPIAAGSTIEASTAHTGESPQRSIPRASNGLAATNIEPVAAVQHIAGWASGHEVDIVAGDFAIGEAGAPTAGAQDGEATLTAGFARRPVGAVRTWLRVTRTGVQVGSADNTVTLVDGKRPADVRNARDSVIRVGASGFIATDVPEPVPERRGPSIVNRPPRIQLPKANLAVQVPARPGSAKTKQALSWATMLAPIPMGIIMALVWSPIFALFILMSPIMFLAQYWESGVAARKDRTRFGNEMTRTLDDLRDTVENVVRRETLRRRSVSPSTPELIRFAEVGSPRLWERRRTSTDALDLVVGYADQHVLLNVESTDDFAEADEIVGGPQVLADTPVVVPLDDHIAVGVVGPRHHALAIASSLVNQACTLHGPADINLGLIVDPDSANDWDWLKWTPHIHGSTGPRVALDLESADELLIDDTPKPEASFSLQAATPTGPFKLVVVDSTEILTHPSSPLRSALTTQNHPARAIIVADHADQLPASCGTVVSVSQAGRVDVHRPGSAAFTPNVLPAGISTGTAERWSRYLGRFSDPEAGGGSAGIPSSVTLTELLPSIEPADILHRWRSRGVDPKPAGPVGVTELGALKIDLAEDGPHGLVAGTTGSGKSELLRTMVASMAAEVDSDHLNFVLIDFKGGGAFDVCADLPHVVSVVTDLDDHLAERALRCLKAELRLREELLRDHQATDLGEYLQSAIDPLPRLVVIIDEFATLAAELPDFLDSLVDIAQRGRSLGVHMILATQRPAGVLDAKVKANTNLRISLRVQDESDSDDVIGTPQAARLSRQQPGRGFVRFGQSEILEFQTALVTGEHLSPDERVPSASAFRLFPGATPVGGFLPPMGEDEAILEDGTIRRAVIVAPVADPPPSTPAVPDAFDPFTQSSSQTSRSQQPRQPQSGRAKPASFDTDETADATSLKAWLASARVNSGADGSSTSQAGSDDLDDDITRPASPSDLAALAARPAPLVNPVQPATPPVAPAPEPANNSEAQTDLRVLVSSIREAWRLGGYDEPRIPWPDPLPGIIDAAELSPTSEDLAAGAAAPFGLMDLPDRQAQLTISWTPAVGNLVLYGIDADDISHTMATIALGMASTHSPNQFHLYGFEFGSSGLNRLAHLPHCGSIVSGGDMERTLRGIGRFEDELAVRRQAVLDGTDVSTMPIMMTLIDNYAGLSEALEEAGEIDILNHLTQVLRDGPAVGMYAIIGSSHERGIPMRVSNLIESKLLFRLVDHSAYGSFGLRPKDVPVLGPARVIDPTSGEIAQMARFNGGELAEAVAGISAQWSGKDHRVDIAPVPIQVLSTDIQLHELEQTGSSADQSLFSTAIGIDAAQLLTAHLKLASGEHALVVGGAGSGRSTTLNTLAETYRALDPTLQIVGIATRRSILRYSAALNVLIDQGTSVQQLHDIISQHRVVILVDDAAAVPPDFAQVLEKVAAEHADERHFIAACRPDYAKHFESWVGPLRTSQTGIALQPGPNDGDAFRSILPIHRPQRFPNGRAFLVQAGVPELIQVAYHPVDPNQPERTAIRAESLAPTVTASTLPDPARPGRDRGDAGESNGTATDSPSLDDIWAEFDDDGHESS